MFHHFFLRSGLARMCCAAAFAFSMIATEALADRRKAVELLDAPVSYQANYVFLSGGKTFRGQVKHAPGRERRDWNDAMGAQAMVIRRDTDTVFFLAPMLRMYLAAGYQETAAAFGDIESLTLDLTAEGTERMAARSARRFRAKGQSPSGATFSGTLWISSEGILLKATGMLQDQTGEQSFETELSDIRMGNVDSQAFEPPKGFTRIALGGMIAPDKIAEMLRLLRQGGSRSR